MGSLVSSIIGCCLNRQTETEFHVDFHNKWLSAREMQLIERLENDIAENEARKQETLEGREAIRHS